LLRKLLARRSVLKSRSTPSRVVTRREEESCVCTAQNPTWCGECGSSSVSHETWWYSWKLIQYTMFSFDALACPRRAPCGVRPAPADDRWRGRSRSRAACLDGERHKHLEPLGRLEREVRKVSATRATLLSALTPPARAATASCNAHACRDKKWHLCPPACAQKTRQMYDAQHPPTSQRLIRTGELPRSHSAADTPTCIRRAD